jgi:heme O synthase-like polyprenyltransferase
MARIAVVVGLLLISVTVATIFANQGFKSPSVFIPAGIGSVLAVLGLVGMKDSLRKHAMHGAALIAMLGGIGCLVMGIRLLSKLGTDAPPTNDKLASVFATAILCLVFVILCVQSFIQARKKSG